MKIFSKLLNVFQQTQQTKSQDDFFNYTCSSCGKQHNNIKRNQKVWCCGTIYKRIDETRPKITDYYYEPGGKHKYRVCIQKDNTSSYEHLFTLEAYTAKEVRDMLDAIKIQYSINPSALSENKNMFDIGKALNNKMYYVISREYVEYGGNYCRYAYEEEWTTFVKRGDAVGEF